MEFGQFEGNSKRLIRQNATDVDEVNPNLKNIDQIITIKRQYHSEEYGKENVKNKFFSRSLPENEAYSKSGAGEQFCPKTVILMREKSCSLIEVNSYLSNVGRGQGVGTGRMIQRPRQQIRLTKQKESHEDQDHSSVFISVLIMLIIFGLAVWGFGFMGLEKQTENDEISETEVLENGTRLEISDGDLDFIANLDSRKEEWKHLRLFQIQ
jgi:hypothetical protein